jgi:hypothetical protein
MGKKKKNILRLRCLLKNSSAENEIKKWCMWVSGFGGEKFYSHSRRKAEKSKRAGSNKKLKNVNGFIQRAADASERDPGVSVF